MVELKEPPQFGMPLGPLLCGCKEVVSNIAQELNFHDVNLLHRYPRHFSPRLVSVSVVIQKFVSKHQSNRQQSEFTSTLPFDARVEFLQPVDEHKGQQDDVLAHLRCRQDRGHPFLESQCGCDFRNECWEAAQAVLNGVQLGCTLEPEQTCHL